MAEQNSTALFDPPNKLKTKIRYGGPKAVTDAVLEKAQSSIAELADDFVEHVKTDIAELRQAHDSLIDGGEEPAECLNQIFHVAHNLKGKGGTFDYDLLTIICNQLCRLIEKISPPLSALDMEVLDLHIDSLQVVHSQNLKGDGGKIGNSLLDGLDQLIQKWNESQ